MSYFLHVLSRIYSLKAWRSSKHFRSPYTINPDIVFVASASDFQRSYDGNYVPDKLELWRREVASLKLNTVFVLMPFSNASGKATPIDVLSIECLVLSSLTHKKRFLGLLYVIKAWRLKNITTPLPLSAYLHSQIWLNFLTRVKPKLVIGIGLTDNILEVCGVLGIKTIEVQHGIFSEIELRRWWRYSSNGINYGPDLFVTWDEHYSNIAATLNIKSLTVGYPHRFQSIDANHKGVSRLEKPSKPIVVVTLSCRLPGGIGPWGMIDKNMDISILKLLSLGILVRLRLHPVVEGGAIRRACISRWLTRRYQNSEVIFPKNESILRTLNNANVHLTIASSTALEASYMGVPTLILEAAYLIPPAVHLPLESGSFLPQNLLSLGIIKTTSKDSLLKNLELFMTLPRSPFMNPLNVSEFKEQITRWTS
jgi:hypothetical protein